MKQAISSAAVRVIIHNHLLQAVRVIIHNHLSQVRNGPIIISLRCANDVDKRGRGGGEQAAANRPLRGAGQSDAR